MDKRNNQPLKLCLTAHPTYLPVVTGFVETGTDAMGMGKEDTLRLRLATEEIFLYLCEAICPESPLDIECFDGLYYTRLTFRFTASGLNLRGLNIASKGVSEEGCDLRDMGLLIASRSVEGLHLTLEPSKRVRLAVTKEKTYPEIAERFPLPQISDSPTLEAADREGVKRFALLLKQYSPAGDLPSCFHYPGRLADMVAGGEYQLILAVNERKEPVGGLLFHALSERVVEACGPYILNATEGQATAEQLLDGCLSRIVRTKALGLLIRSGLPSMIEDRFERLGRTIFHATGRPTADHSSFFRLLHEDPGCDVWSSQGLFSTWLERVYDRLVLIRNIRISRNMGETKSGFSLLSAELLRERGDATLRPLLPGADFAVNLANHIRLIRQEGFLNLFFEIDLGIAWQAEMVPVLTANGFEPEILLPFAGQADLVIFQHHDAAES